MKAVIQRVKSVVLSVEKQEVSKIGQGLAVYLGIAEGDDEKMAETMAKKIVSMRIMQDDDDKMNLSVLDCKGEIMLISQFTLLADCKRGNRPSFTGAEKPERANNLYLYFFDQLKSFGINVEKGVFGADMTINQVNDGPVTIILES